KTPADVLPADFVEALAGFVKQGKGLVIYAGDNVAPDAYNRILGKKHGLLPLAIAGVAEPGVKNPLKLNPDSAGLPAYWKFRDDGYYKGFKDIEVYKALDLLEPAQAARKEALTNEEPKDKDKQQDPLTVVFRFNNDKPAVVSRLAGS